MQCQINKLYLAFGTCVVLIFLIRNFVTLVSRFQLLVYERFHEIPISFHILLKKLKRQLVHLSRLFRVFQFVFPKSSIELFMISFHLRNLNKNGWKKHRPNSATVNLILGIVIYRLRYIHLL